MVEKGYSIPPERAGSNINDASNINTDIMILNCRNLMNETPLFLV